jgi:hypothetical protein
MGVMMTPELVHGDEHAREYRHDAERPLLADWSRSTAAG